MTTYVKEFAYFQNLGAVLEIVRFPIKQAQKRTTKYNVITLIEELSKRYRHEFTKNNPNLNIDDYFNIKIDYQKASLLEGTSIDLQTLWGEGYDMAHETINLYEYCKDARIDKTSTGLAHALLNPPYGLQSPSDFPTTIGRERENKEKKWMASLVNKFNVDVLQIDIKGNLDHLVIEEWPTNWTNYFDAGHEWWGAFLWSILDRNKKWITVIAASETD